MTVEDEIIPVDDVGADIRAAAESLGTKLSSADAVSPPSDATEVPEVAQSDRARDASGKFIPKTVEQSAPETVSDADQKTEQPEQQSSAATPPSFLSAEAKAEWAKTPAAVQAAFLKRDADANEGGRQWSEQKQHIEQAIAPLHELSQQNGIPWQEGLNRLLTVENSLRNPATAPQMVQQLAHAYGVDLAALVNGSPQPQRPNTAPQFDPSVIPQIVEQTVSQRLAAWQQDQALNGEITGFASAKTPDGQIAHPHFNAVRPTMGLLLQNGQATTMQEAYDKAIWLTPETRPQPQVQVNQQQQVQKARNAAVSPKGAPVNGVAKPKGFDAAQSLTDDIREAAAMVSRH